MYWWPHHKHACRKGEAGGHKGQQALQPLLPALLTVFVNAELHAQREAAYAFANLLAAKGNSTYRLVSCVLHVTASLCPTVRTGM